MGPKLILAGGTTLSGAGWSEWARKIFLVGDPFGVLSSGGRVVVLRVLRLKVAS